MLYQLSYSRKEKIILHWFFVKVKALHGFPVGFSYLLNSLPGRDFGGGGNPTGRSSLKPARTQEDPLAIETTDETYLSTQPAQAQKQAWLSGAYELEERA